ncbi:MAG: aldo/keto [Geobacteraceae bacterium]|nr:MAG: aldo/keto [Geobacteraceae bacterium]
MTVRKVKLGRTGYTVSVIGFGALPIQRLGTTEAISVLRHAMIRGINFIDTAHGYSNSEEKIGGALQRGGDEIILATKTPARDAETALRHVDTSLARMGVDFIHIYQLHAVNGAADLAQVLAPGGALEGLKRAREMGKIGHIGITGHRPDALAEALRTGEFATVQVPYNFIETEPERELFPLAGALDVGIIIMKPLGGGMLNNATISLKYILQQPGVVPIPGFETVEEVDEILAIADGCYRLHPGEKEELEAIKGELGRRFCRRCNYCAPCPQGIHIPQAMILHTLLKRLGTKHFTAGWGKDALEKAETCIGCGACEPRCPYELAIPEIINGNVRHVRGELGAAGL